MARLLLDHCFEMQTAAALDDLGHDAVTARDLRVHGAPDYVVLRTAIDERRVLVTHNIRDFRVLHCAWLLWSTHWGSSAEHPGILGIPQASGDVALYARWVDACMGTRTVTNELHLYDTRRGWSRYACP